MYSTYSDTHAYSRTNANANTYGNSNANTYGNSNTDTYSNANADSYTSAHADSSSQPGADLTSSQAWTDYQLAGSVVDLVRRRPTLVISEKSFLLLGNVLDLECR